VFAFDSAALVLSLAVTRSFGAIGVAYAVVSLSMLMLSGTYRVRFSVHLADRLMRVAEVLGWAVAATALMTFSWQTLQVLLRPGVAAVIMVLVGRGMANVLIRHLRKGGVLHERALVIGAGRVGTEIAAALRDHPEYGIAPVGIVDTDPDRTARVSDITFDIADPLPTIRRLGVTRVIVAPDEMSDTGPVDILRECAALPLDVHVVPRPLEFGAARLGPHVDEVWGFRLIRLTRPASSRSARRAKRLFDLVVGGLLLVLSAPVFALVAVAVHLSSPGPVFFRQKRVGESGRVIQMLKFRTLLCNDDSDKTWYVGDDERRTPVGRFLRRTGLDELPQLLNVLRGDMSLVGPRPERPHFASTFAAEVPRYGDRQRMPQGITGWAQVHGLRGDTSIADRVRFDNYYIDHSTLWWDIRILARTVAAVLGRTGA